MVPTRAAALVLALCAAGCAFRRGDPLPGDPPRDFSIAITAREGSPLPWFGRVSMDRRGSVDYDVTFRDPPSNRRGSEPLEAEARGRAWAAVVAAGFFDREPVPVQEAAGSVAVEGRALGLAGRWTGDPAADPDLASLLDALRQAAPTRVFRPLPAEEPRR